MTQLQQRMIRINFGEGQEPVEIPEFQVREANQGLNLDNDDDLKQALAAMLDTPEMDFVGLEIYRGEHIIIGPVPKFG